MPVGNPHGDHSLHPKSNIGVLWRIANQEPVRAVGQIDLMMECQMEQKISGISKFPEKIDNLERLIGIFETKFSKYFVPFDSVPEFQEILA